MAKQNNLCYQELRKYLLRGSIPPATRIKEVAWSEKLGVNRGALREAMGRLTQEGLLVSGERGGYFVPEYREEDIREIMEMRLAIERGALHLLKKKSKAKPDLDALKKCCDMMDVMMKENIELGFMEADVKFHKELVALADNRKITEFYDKSSFPLIFYFERPSEELQHGQEQSIKEHREMLRLLSKKSYDECADLLEIHLGHQDNFKA